MIRANIDFLAVLVLLAGVGVLSQVRQAIRTIPVAVNASMRTQQCVAARAIAKLAVFRTTQ
jgi:hypothetical protein